MGWKWYRADQYKHQSLGYLHRLMGYLRLKLVVDTWRMKMNMFIDRN